MMFLILWPPTPKEIEKSIIFLKICSEFQVLSSEQYFRYNIFLWESHKRKTQEERHNTINITVILKIYIPIHISEIRLEKWHPTSKQNWRKALFFTISCLNHKNYYAFIPMKIIPWETLFSSALDEAIKMLVNWFVRDECLWFYCFYSIRHTT